MLNQSYPRVTVAGTPEFYVSMRCGHCAKKNRLRMAEYRESMGFKCSSCKRTNLFPERPQ